MNYSVGLLINKISNQLKRQIEQVIGNKNELTKTQSMILCYIVHHDNEYIYQKDIEKDFSIRRSTATEILNLMEKKDLIKRISCVHDKRINKIIVTEKGRQLEEYGREKINHLEKQMVSSLTEEEQKLLLILLSKVEKNLIEREK